MTLDALKPNQIFRGPLFAEPLDVLVTTSMGDAVKLMGRGVPAGKVVDPILTAEQLDLLPTTPESEPLNE